MYLRKCILHILRKPGKHIDHQHNHPHSRHDLVAMFDMWHMHHIQHSTLKSRQHMLINITMMYSVTVYVLIILIRIIFGRMNSSYTLLPGRVVGGFDVGAAVVGDLSLIHI